jgi:hypothetical protein
MTPLPIYVGLDDADTAVQITVLDPAGGIRARRRCDNDGRALAAAAAPFGAPFGAPLRAALERGAGAANRAEELLARAGGSVDLAPRVRGPAEAAPGQDRFAGRPPAGRPGAGRLPAAGVAGARADPGAAAAGPLPAAGGDRRRRAKQAIRAPLRDARQWWWPASWPRGASGP